MPVRSIPGASSLFSASHRGAAFATYSARDKKSARVSHRLLALPFTDHATGNLRGHDILTGGVENLEQMSLRLVQDCVPCHAGYDPWVVAVCGNTLLVVGRQPRGWRGYLISIDIPAATGERLSMHKQYVPLSSSDDQPRKRLSVTPFPYSLDMDGHPDRRARASYCSDLPAPWQVCLAAHSSYSEALPIRA